MLYSLVLTAWYPPLYAIMFEQVLPRMRGMTSSLYIIVTTLFGIGIGPFVVGMISDAKGGNLAAAILSINWVAPAIVVMLIALVLRVRRDEEGLIERARRGGEALAAASSPAPCRPAGRAPGLRRQPDVGRLGPVAVQAEAHAGSGSGWWRSVPSAIACASNSSRSLRCSSRRLQICTIQPSPSGASLLARYEARLLQARHRAAPPVLLGAGGEVLVEQAVHEQAAGAAAAQLHRPAQVHLQQPAVPVRQAGEAVVDARELGGGVGEALDAGEVRRT